jgi:glucuronate isomerase
MTVQKRKWKATTVHKRIKDLDLAAQGVWRPDAIRKACADNFNDWYNTNVKDKKRQNFDRAFHVTAQRSAAYKKKGCMLDLMDGPIISEEAHAQLLQDESRIETVDVANTPEAI